MSDSVFSLDRTLEQRRQAVANLYDFVVRGDLSDQRKLPSEVIEQGRKRILHRYQNPAAGPTGDPVLLVPPLGAQAACFDLRRGNSLVEHLTAAGRPTYLVEYGGMTFADRKLGIEFWINDVLPPAIRRVSSDAGGRPVNLLGWCMGGLLSLGAAAAHPDLPINAIAMVASPFDMSKNPMLAPVRKVAELTGGNLVGTAFRVLGGAPAALVGPAFKATSLLSYVKKPLTLWRHRDDRDFLAQVEAVDSLMNSMHAYPGRATLQAYHRLAISNELASGKIQGPTRLLDLAEIRSPVISIAGESDVLVPVAVAHHVGALLPNATEVRLETAPGGHLGVLTGRSARQTTWALIDEFLAAHAAAS